MTHLILSWCWSYLILKALNVWNERVVKSSNNQKRLVFEDRYRKREITWTYVILSRVVAKFSTTWVQRDLMSSILMNSNICKEGKSKDTLRKRFNYLENGRVEEIVTIVVWDEGVDHRREKVALEILTLDGWNPVGMKWSQVSFSSWL